MPTKESRLTINMPPSFRARLRQHMLAEGNTDSLAGHALDLLQRYLAIKALHLDFQAELDELARLKYRPRKRLTPQEVEF